MLFFEQVSVVLFFIVSTQIILCVVLIRDYRKFSGANLGPKIGTIIDKNNFDFRGNDSDNDKVIVFVDIGCTSCEKVIKSLQINGTKFNNIYVITKGSKNDVDTWKKNKNLLLDINSLEDNIIEENYNIKGFPYYIKITDNKVSEKGFLNEITIIKLYKEVEQ
ncbi:MAG: hypothetical protein E7J99_14600 [Clostridium butyricum]|uniref:hypothetical protein n=1 Tax=Clostridium sp. TaxID=1506 RepID=UPI00290418F2|nr:hypothetical protein [Clostridium sp.]MDU1117058.1 hypothetical protein [Clostridium sp.]MDU7713382.1 hypothetical protein [Clostridium butyricum]